MKKIMISSLVLLATAAASANLSAPVRGQLRSFNYVGGEQGYYLTINGDSAKELYNSIQNSGGTKDKMDYSSTNPRNGVTTNSTTIYSTSMACTESVSNMAPAGKNEYKVEYSCELTINKRGTVKGPARG